MANSLRNFLTGIGLSIGAVTGGVYIADFEGYSAQAYYDIAQKLSVCRGHTGSEIIIGKTYTEEECNALFARDIKKADDALLLLAPIPLSNGEHGAYLSFIFNLGEGNFATSTLRQKLLAGDRVGACYELTNACGKYGCNGWIYAHGIQWPGLASRRAKERQLCLSEITK
ncbi:lysozyme [Shewanella yunxiaonensis]|uniref:Lysozyme n=1 Tax=Shewanella yunxiaonensis TaxID=2829809 RepID=A0ABX7YUR2_9GAMM|nr:lysozyme [Shewanella yunxiaonensis]QUN06447.1 lysozyme [Shewanella yunxiaonensis]